MANRRELAARRLRVADEESSIRAAVTPPAVTVPLDEVAPPDEAQEAVAAVEAIPEVEEAPAPAEAPQADEGAPDVVEKEPTVRFTVDLEKPAHKRLKLLALEAELRAVDLVRAALSLADEDEALLARIVDRARKDRAQ